MSRSGCASTPAFGREEAPIGAAFTARLKPCPSGLVARRVDCWLRRRNAGILPAPASKLAGDPVRFAQNDKRKTEADSLSTPTSKFARRGPWSTGMTSKRQATTEILSLRLRMTSKNEQIRRFWLRQNDDFSGGCARMTSKNRQRQGQRPGAKARFFDGDGIAQAKAWAYLRNNCNSKVKNKSRFPSGMTNKKDKYGDSGCARMTNEREHITLMRRVRAMNGAPGRRRCVQTVGEVR